MPRGRWRAQISSGPNCSRSSASDVWPQSDRTRPGVYSPAVPPGNGIRAVPPPRSVQTPQAAACTVCGLRFVRIRPALPVVHRFARRRAHPRRRAADAAPRPAAGHRGLCRAAVRAAAHPHAAAAHGGFPRQAHRLHAARHLRRARPQQARSDRLRLPGYPGAGRQFQPQAVFQRPLGLCRRGLPPRALADAAGPPELCIY